MAITGYMIAFRGSEPPTLGQVCDLLDQGAGTDQFDAEFALRQLPQGEVEHLVGEADRLGTLRDTYTQTRGGGQQP